MIAFLCWEMRLGSPTILTKRHRLVVPWASIAGCCASDQVVHPGPVLKQASEGRGRDGHIAGEIDFPTPDHINPAAKAPIDQVLAWYTDVGEPQGQNATGARKFQHNIQHACITTNIHVATGGTQVIFNALMAALNAGAEVVPPSPYGWRLVSTRCAWRMAGQCT